MRRDAKSRFACWKSFIKKKKKKQPSKIKLGSRFSCVSFQDKAKKETSFEEQEKTGNEEVRLSRMQSPRYPARNALPFIS